MKSNLISDIFRRLFRDRLCLPLLATLALNFFTYNITRIWTSGRYHMDLTTELDNAIPVISWTATIYLASFLFWIVNYAIGIMQNKNVAYHFLSSDFFAKFCCLIIFLAIPTTNIRPEISATGFFDKVLLFIYSMDPADNLLPSIHCLTSHFCCIAVRNNERIPKWYKIFSHIFAVMIYISTLTTKQHVLIDVLAGVLLAEFAFRFTKKTGFDGFWQRLFDKGRVKNGKA
ncbi:MAG: phosphatase PAP2 family protein [Lachnospiraceae bacterium]|nr:phosphatase PAP2 family protein [Lachnospiraceae bacterium]MBQ9580024.1 phosphatase PAP2 family protein [Lachnospiraceae bacterium]MBR0435159.1 phosphatase PAP2 family protein [Lachnospiraceae bacterium]